MRWLIWLAFVIAWTVALELPVPVQEEMPGGEFIVTNKVVIAKTAHIAAYALLTVLSAWVPTTVRYRWLMMFFLMGHAWGSELLQYELEDHFHRTGSLRDVGFDVIGIIVGVVLSWRWWTRA